MNTHLANIDHLRKQAKDLLRLYRRGEAAAFERLRAHLPAARGKSDAALSKLQLRLHDMQSCLAREHGCASWTGAQGPRVPAACPRAGRQCAAFVLAAPGLRR